MLIAIIIFASFIYIILNKKGMNKVIYLLGAGASYGSREKGTEKIERGVPLVNELSSTIDQLCDELESIKKTPWLPPNRELTFRNSLPSSIEESYIKEELLWLKQCCNTELTIDTYAKILYDKKSDEYDRLKRALSLFFTLIQDPLRVDPRYSNFLSKIMNFEINGDISKRKDIAILSWNYDSQFEFAYNKIQNINSIPKIWKKLNIYCKSIEAMIEATRSLNKFCIIKLNGTAFMYDKTNLQIVDTFFDPYSTMGIIPSIYKFYLDKYKNIDTGLSFAWEKDSKIKQSIEKTVYNADVLVIIGYSFPDYNRDIDKEIFDKMPNLKKIYIQDKDPNIIKQRIMQFITTKKDYNFMLCQDVTQFVIPMELTL